MKYPLILVGQGDVSLFRNASDLERYVEFPDLSTYLAYDAGGWCLSLIAAGEKGRSEWLVPVHPIRIDQSKPPRHDPEALRRVLDDLLRHAGIHPTGEGLEQLIAQAVSKLGYSL